MYMQIQCVFVHVCSVCTVHVTDKLFLLVITHVLQMLVFMLVVFFSHCGHFLEFDLLSSLVLYNKHSAVWFVGL